MLAARLEPLIDPFMTSLRGVGGYRCGKLRVSQLDEMFVVVTIAWQSNVNLFDRQSIIHHALSQGCSATLKVEGSTSSRDMKMWGKKVSKEITLKFEP